MRLIVNLPAGTGLRIFASNAGSTGTIASPHLYLTVGRAGNRARALAVASDNARARSGGTCGVDGLRGGVGCVASATAEADEQSAKPRKTSRLMTRIRPLKVIVPCCLLDAPA
jgi:hypothetical protein